MSEIRDAIYAFLKRYLKHQVIRGQVVSVNTTQCTMEVQPLDDSAVMPAVQLRAGADGNNTGVVLFPRKGSVVLVGLIGNNYNSAYLVKADDLETIKISRTGQGAFSIEVNAAGDVILNSGNNGGLVKVNDMVQSLNNIENSINDLKALVTSWTPVSGDGGLALKTILSTWQASSLPVSSAVQLEDTKVKH